MSKNAPIEIIPGETAFRSTYADGNPLWRITGRAGPGAWFAVSEDIDYGGMRKAFTTEEVTRAVQWSRNVQGLFADHDLFWEDAPLGAVMHYHDSFGRYVRGTVVVLTEENTEARTSGRSALGQKGLLPTALVGKWEPRDLCSRDAEGRPKYGYHAQKIVDGDGAWQPSHTCMLEGTHKPRAGEPDPRTLPALSLDPPPPRTGPDARVERLVRARNAAARRMEETYRLLAAGNGDALEAHLRRLARFLVEDLDAADKEV